MTKLVTRTWNDVAQEHWDRGKTVLVLVLPKYDIDGQIKDIEDIGWKFERKDEYTEDEDGSERMSTMFLRPDGCT